MLAKLLCVWYRKITFAVLMESDDITQVYSTGAVHIHTTLEYNIFTLPPLPSIAEEETAKAIMTFYTLILVIFTILGISVYMKKRVHIQIIPGVSLFPTLPSFLIVIKKLCFNILWKLSICLKLYLQMCMSDFSCLGNTNVCVRHNTCLHCVIMSLWQLQIVENSIGMVEVCGLQTGHSCMPFYPVKWVLPLVNIDSSNTVWAYFTSVVYSHSNYNWQDILTPGTFRNYLHAYISYLQAIWTGIILMYVMEHVIKLPSKVQVSVWTDILIPANQTKYRCNPGF